MRKYFKYIQIKNLNVKYFYHKIILLIMIIKKLLINLVYSKINKSRFKREINNNSLLKIFFRTKISV